MPDPAPTRETDEAYKEYIESHDCLACFEPADDAHHLDTRGSGGSDYTCIPLCRGHHTEIGTMPLREFEEKYGFNAWRQTNRFLRRYFSDHTNPAR